MTSKNNEITGRDNHFQLKLNCSSSGQSAKQESQVFTVSIFREPLLNAVEEMSPYQLELFTQCLKGYEKKDLLLPAREAPSLVVLSVNTITSQIPDSQSSIIQPDYSLTCPSGPHDEHELPELLGSELFFTKWVASPLSVLLGKDEQMAVIGRAKYLRKKRNEGWSNFYVLIWDCLYCLDLVWRHLVGRLQDAAEIIKIIDIK